MTEILLNKKAIALFQDWATNALIAFPNLNLQIKEYAVFTIDLKSSMDSGKKTLLEKDYKNRRLDSYDYGFMCGFIQSNLNTNWNSEYIFKQSNEYKIFAAIKALESYLEFDEVMAARLNGLYKNYYESTINFDNADAFIKIDLKNEINFLSPELIKQKNGFKTAIENVILHYISIFYNKNDGEFLKDAQNYFTKEEIYLFINSED